MRDALRVAGRDAGGGAPRVAVVAARDAVAARVAVVRTDDDTDAGGVVDCVARGITVVRARADVFVVVSVVRDDVARLATVPVRCAVVRERTD